MHGVFLFGSAVRQQQGVAGGPPRRSARFWICTGSPASPIRQNTHFDGLYRQFLLPVSPRELERKKE